MHRPAPIAALALLLFAAGCSTTSVFERLRVGKASPENPAIEVVCLWQPAKGTGANGLPTRGMAGQIMFFTRGSAAPVIADGDVRIYEFDDQGTADELRKPIHQFDFRATDWQNFLNQGTLGPCYNIFVPYVKGGHKQVEVTMQLRFTPKGAPTLYSDMTSVTLPGTIDSSDDGDPLAPPLARVKAESDAAPVHGGTTSGLSVKSITGSTPPSKARSEHPLAQPQATADATTPQSSSGIQPASYEVPAAPDSGNKSDTRIRELEQMVRELTQQQATRRNGTPDVPPRDRTPRTLSQPAARELHSPRVNPLASEEPENAIDDNQETPRRRFRLSAAASSPNEPSTARPNRSKSGHPLRMLSDEGEPHETPRQLPRKNARPADRSDRDADDSAESASSTRIRVRSVRAARAVAPAEEQDIAEMVTERPAKPAGFEWQGGDPWQSN